MRKRKRIKSIGISCIRSTDRVDLDYCVLYSKGKGKRSGGNPGRFLALIKQSQKGKILMEKVIKMLQYKKGRLLRKSIYVYAGIEGDLSLLW